MSVLIKNARPLGGKKSQDWLIHDDDRVEKGSGLKTPTGTKVIDRGALVITKGLVDTWARVSGPEEYARESLAHYRETALRHGITQVVSRPHRGQIVEDAGGYEAWRRYVGNVGDAVGVSGLGLSTWGSLLKQDDGRLSVIDELRRSGVAGVVLHEIEKKSDPILRRALSYAAQVGALVVVSPRSQLDQGVSVHEGAVASRAGLKGSPAASELLAIQRIVVLVELTGARVHFEGLSSALGVQAVQQAKSRGLAVSASVRISNLLFTEERIASYDTRYKVWPPLRSEDDRQALVQAARIGVIDVVSSNHCGWSSLDKECAWDDAKFDGHHAGLLFSGLWSLFGGDLESEQAIERLIGDRAAELAQIERSGWVVIKDRTIESKDLAEGRARGDEANLVVASIDQGRVVFQS